MNVTIELDNASGCTTPPSADQFRRWSTAALSALELPTSDYALSIRLVDETESASLNGQYRGKTGATNILSFPFTDFPDLPGTARLLGDLAICAQVVQQEARQQGKNSDAHWAHLTVHGVLHLNGYDHAGEEEARIMEALEVHILANLGFADPYEFTTLDADSSQTPLQTP